MNSFLLPPSAVLVMRILDSRNATEPMIEMTSSKPPFSIKEQGTKLERCTPEQAGVPSSYLYEFLEKIRKDTSLNIHNILISRHGKILCEASFGAQQNTVWKYTFSACKSIVSLAIGMLVDVGLLSLEEKIVDIFPREFGTISKLKLKGLSVDDVLTMRATLQFAEADSMTTTEWLKGFLNSSTKGEIGKTFKYNSLNTYLLAAIVGQKTGQSLTDFLDKRLFSPLGIVNYYWEKSPQNIEKGGWGLYLLPEDFVKIAHMALCDGVYNEKRIISAEYLKSATAKHVEVVQESQNFDYGYQMWTGKNSDTFLFNGMLGQNVLSFRKNGIVIVINAGNGEFFPTGQYFRYLTDLFDRDFGESLPKNRKGEKQLNRLITSLSLYSPKKISFRERVLRIFCGYKNSFDNIIGDYSFSKGHKQSVGIMPLILQVVQNSYTKGFESVSFYKKENKPYLLYCETERKYEIPLSFDKPTVKHYSFHKLDFLVSSYAKFKYDEQDRLVLIVQLDFLETPCSRILKFIFDTDGRVWLHHTENPGEAFVSEASLDYLRQISNLPVPFLSGIIERFGEDFLELKLKKALSPILLLVKKQNEL